MNSIDLSIILPVYNGGEFLDRCLVSLLRQTVCNFEIIVVNDGSIDNSRDIILSYISRFPDRFIFLDQKNGGPSKARNAGLVAAHGEYIGFIDSDDWVDADYYLRLILAARQEQADLVVSGRCDVLTDTVPPRFVRRIPADSYPCASIFEAPGLLSETTQFIWDKLFRRDIIEKNGLLFDERFRYTEDVLFLCKYKFYCQCIYTTPLTMYYHFQHDNNPAAKYGSSLLDVPEVLREIFEFYREKNSFTPLYDAFFDLAAKRLLFRIDRYPYMNNKPLQYAFYKQTVQVLKDYFPDWRRRLIHYGSNGGGVESLYRVNSFLMKIYINLPGSYVLRRRQALRLKKEKREQRNIKRKALANRLMRYFGLFRTAYYRFCLNHLSLRNDTVFIESKGGRDLAGNMLTLLRESLRQGKKVQLSIRSEYSSRFTSLCRRYGIATTGISVVRPDTFSYYRSLATSKYLFHDSALPHWFIKRKNQCYLNTWHGVPLKQMGIDVPGRAYAIRDVQHNLLLADYLLFPNRFMQEKMFQAYMLNGLYSGRIITESYPRVSVLLDEQRRTELRNDLGLQNYKVVCYLPTWRGILTKKENAKQHADCLYYLRHLDRLLDDDMLFYVKLHPYSQKGFHPGSYKHIRMFPEDYETYDFLSVCDTLVTDYSSVFFDFAFTGRKIILFAYDYEEYLQVRGLYLSLNDLPFPLVTTVHALYRELCEPKSYDDSLFIEEYCPYDAHNTASAICSMLFGKPSVTACRTAFPEFTKLPVLFYGGLLTPDTATAEMYRLLTLQQESVPIRFGVLSPAMQSFANRLDKALVLADYISIDPNLFYTPLEALAYLLILKKRIKIKLLSGYLERLFLREYYRNFGTLQFAAVVIFDRSDQRLTNVLSAAPNTKVLFYEDNLPQIAEQLKNHPDPYKKN